MNKKRNKLYKDIADEWLNQKWEEIYLDGKKSPYSISDQGFIWSSYVGKIMSPAPNSDGYMTTVLAMDGKKYTVGVHRLVALAFIPNPLNLPEVNHKNGNKMDNTVGNLEWVSHQENMLHANQIGLRSHILGDENPNNKYPVELIQQICVMLSNWWRPADIARELHISNTIVKNIASGKEWTSISSKYSLPEFLHVNVLSSDGKYSISDTELLHDIGLPDTICEEYQVRIEFRTNQKYKVQRSSHGYVYESKPINRSTAAS